MTRQLREFHRPASAAEATALLQRADVRTAPLALGPRVPDNPLDGVEAVVELSRLGLAYIQEDADGVVHLGGMTPLQSLVESALLQSLADGIVATAAGLAGGSAMRHAATVGGAISDTRQAAAGLAAAGPSELVAALLVLQAEVVVVRAGQGEEAIAIGEYMDAPADTEAGDLLLECRFSHPTGSAHAVLTRVARTPRDQSLVAAVALIDQGLIRIAVSAGGSLQLLPVIEQGAARLPIAPAVLDDVSRQAEAAVSPITDFRGSAEYRRSMAGVLARRALAEAASKGAR